MLKNYEFGGTSFKCPKCDHNTGKRLEDEVEIEALIIDNIKRNNY
jgi:hypothetical protein